MPATTKQRRLIENESKFREFNESVQEKLDDLDKKARDEGWNENFSEPDMPFYFYCECSDENCTERVQLTLRDYNTIHEQRNRFVLVSGHEVPEIEHSLEQTDEYCVVEKKILPPEHVDHLHKTDVDNT